MGCVNSHQTLAKNCCDQSQKLIASSETEDLITENLECISKMTHDAKEDQDVFHKGSNAISWCCFHGDIDRLTHLSKLNEKKTLGRSFDPLVVSSKNITALDHLLSGFELTVRAASFDKITSKAFYLNKATKYLECLKFLLKMDPNRNNENLLNKHIHPKFNTTPLQLLCYINLNPADAINDDFKKTIQDMAIELLANGAEVNPSNSDPSKHNNESIKLEVNELEEFPAKMFGYVLRASPLHLACLQGNQYLVGELLTAGANVNAVDSINETPLMYAAKYGHVACFKILCGTPNVRFDLSQTRSYFFSVVHYCILQYRSRASFSSEQGIVDMREMLDFLVEHVKNNREKFKKQRIYEGDKEIDPSPKFALTDFMKKSMDAVRKATPRQNRPYPYDTNALRMWVEHIAFTPEYQQNLDPCTRSENMNSKLDLSPAFRFLKKDRETMLQKVREVYDEEELKLDAEYEKEMRM